MIIGSFSKETLENRKVEVEETCELIANALLLNDATLLICSLFEDSADYWVYKAFSKEKPNRTELFYFENFEVINKINSVDLDKAIILHTCLKDDASLDNTNKYLVCQLCAMESADVIIVIGGKTNNSAKLFLKLAELRNKKIIPIVNFNGIAEIYYESHKYIYGDRVPDSTRLFKTGKADEIIKTLINLRNTTVSGNKRVFISYARSKKKWADATEVYMRRRGIDVFRDENDMKPGSSIQENIMKGLRSSTIFIALYCEDYACSPWCYDELDEALKLKESQGMCVWIICLDKTRMVHPRARDMIYYPAKSRKGLISQLSFLACKYLERE